MNYKTEGYIPFILDPLSYPKEYQVAIPKSCDPVYLELKAFDNFFTMYLFDVYRTIVLDIYLVLVLLFLKSAPTVGRNSTWVVLFGLLPSIIKNGFLPY